MSFKIASSILILLLYASFPPSAYTRDHKDDKGAANPRQKQKTIIVPFKGKITPLSVGQDVLISWLLQKNGCLDSDGEGKTGPSHKKGSVSYLQYNQNTKKKEIKKFTDHCKDEGGSFVYEGHCGDYKSYGNDPISPKIFDIVSCKKTEHCKNGVCVPFSCVDSDDGLNFTVAGNITQYNDDGTINGLPSDDWCSSSTQINEFFCKKLTDGTLIPANQLQDCCAFEMVCKDKKCTSEASTSELEVCNKINDKCPGMAGIQTNFLYDNDKNGVFDSCGPVSDDFCSDPDPKSKYPNSTFYSYGDKLHAAFCDPAVDGQLIHVICGDDKQWTIDETMCEWGMPCQNGACLECWDSDGGINKDVYGYVKVIAADGMGLTLDDDCAGFYLIHEFYCDGDTFKYKQFECEDGTVCKKSFDGNVANGSVSCAPEAQKTCTDSDGGNNKDVYGYVEGTNPNGESYKHYDSCGFGNDSMMEYYCYDDNAYGKISIPCEDGTVCKQVGYEENGSFSCIPEAEKTCTDSDGGINKDVYGYVEGIDALGEDYKWFDKCDPWIYGDQYAIYEYYCDGGEYKGKFVPCQEDTICKHVKGGAFGYYDACVLKCIDTDEANNPGIFGEVVDFINPAQPDFCDGNVLKQYKCNSATNEYTEAGETTCPNGCSGGECI